MVRVEKSADVSLMEVARAAKVSVCTASRVMNGNAKVNALLRRRVMMSGRKLGFVPKLRRRRIGIITGRPSPGLPIGYTSVMTAMIMRMAAARRIEVELFDVESLEDIASCHIDAAIGVIFDDRIQELLAYPNLPVVTINHPMVDRKIHGVYTDHFEHGYLAARHLIERGHTRIGFLATVDDEWGSMERRRGYEQAMKEADLTPDPSLIRYAIREPVYDIIQRLVRNGATALLNFSEDAAAEVLHILSNILKLRIGKDISTITTEELPIFQYFNPPQTVIRQPLDQLARLAVEYLDKRFAGNDETEEGREPKVLDRCLKAELIVRDSVADLRE